MAIVNLGTRVLNVGDNPAAYNAFDYIEDKAYAIYADFTVANFSCITSFIRIRPLVRRGGQPNRLLADYIDLTPLARPQLFYIPCSKLFGGDGNIRIFAERLSFWTGGGDGEPLSLELSYDDELETQTWR